MKRRRGKWILAVLLLVVMAGGFLFSQQSLVTGTFVAKWGRDAYRFYSREQVRDLHSFFEYWLAYTTKLTYDDSLGVYSFRPRRDRAEMAGKVDQAGILAYLDGDFDAAVEKLEAYHRQRGEREETLFWLAMAYLRKGEAENCLALIQGERGAQEAHRQQHGKHSGEGLGMQGRTPPVCMLPVEMTHSQDQPSAQAAQLFRQLLDEFDSESIRYRWLLNFAHMTLGAYPEDVPAPYLLENEFLDLFYGEPREEIKRRYSEIKLVDRAKHFGVDTYDCGKGVAVEDFNGDGFLDIVTGGSVDPTRLYLNDGGQGFVDRSEASGLAAITGGHLITAADYDNDGHIDILIGHPHGTRDGGGISLMKNAGDGVFSNETRSSGLFDLEEHKDSGLFNWSSSWGDIDNDGDLDLFLSNWSGLSVYRAQPLIPSRLYRNDGGSFVDVSKEMGLEGFARSNNNGGSAFGDYNGDGYLDLVVTSFLPGYNMLFENVGGQSFVPAEKIYTGNDLYFMTSFIDLNQDGLLDVFANTSVVSDAVYRKILLGQNEEHYGAPMVWLQGGDGSFTQRPDFFIDQLPMGSMGVNFGDLNNDGAYDFYLGKGNPEPWFIMPNLLYLGQLDNGVPTGFMENISSIGEVSTIQKGHGIVFFDVDNDGDQDLYSSLGGMWPSDAWPNQLLINEGEYGNSWVKLRLRGVRANRFGLGSRIAVFARDAAGKPIVRRYHVDNQTGFGSSPYLAHIGLLNAAEIERVEVTWLGDEVPQVYQAELNSLTLLVQR